VRQDGAGPRQDGVGAGAIKDGQGVHAYIAGLQGTELHWRTRIPTLSQRQLSTETVRKYASALAQFHRWIEETHVLVPADGELPISWGLIREWFAARVSKSFSGFARPALRLVHGAVAPNDAAWIHLSTM
jgi:hypothetical protein